MLFYHTKLTDVEENSSSCGLICDSGGGEEAMKGKGEL